MPEGTGPSVGFGRVGLSWHVSRDTARFHGAQYGRDG